MTSSRLVLPTASPEETASLAGRLAPRLRPGDCLLLQGPIGAGKTHFARALIQSVLLVPEDVPSPTYTLVQSYDTRIGEIWHADLYRLSASDEVLELGLADAFESAICLVEWPDRLGDLTPASALTATFDACADRPESRDIGLTWHDPRWDDVFEGWDHV